MENELIDYYQEQQISRQWLDFLRAFAEELVEQANVDELHFLMHSTGERLAFIFKKQLPAIDDLACLEEELNAYWRYMNWGYARLEEVENHINITHFACPLAFAFGEAAVPWAKGFLEGFYQTVFRALGAGTRLQVRSTGASARSMNLCFRFGTEQSLPVKRQENDG